MAYRWPAACTFVSMSAEEGVCQARSSTGVTDSTAVKRLYIIDTVVVTVTITVSVNCMTVRVDVHTLKMHTPSTASNKTSSRSNGSQKPCLSGLPPDFTNFCACFDACPARALAKPTPSRPMQGPRTGVAHETLQTNPANCRTKCNSLVYYHMHQTPASNQNKNTIMAWDVVASLRMIMHE